jgi:hypothetical protein
MATNEPEKKPLFGCREPRHGVRARSNGRSEQIVADGTGLIRDHENGSSPDVHLGRRRHR